MIHPDLQITLDQLLPRLQQPAQLSQEGWNRIEHCHAWLQNKIATATQPMYGINTGFGSLCKITIPNDQLEQLQLNLVMSHACGAGQPLHPRLVRLMLLLKVQSLAHGHSGVSPQVVQRLLDFYNLDILPVVYEQGSLGASGDLVPLAHLVLPMAHLGEVWHRDGHGQYQRYPSHEIMQRHQLEPLRFGAKEGLALLNGTQFMQALLADACLQARDLMAQANMLAALSLEAFMGRQEPFWPQLQGVRPHAGQAAAAAQVLSWLEDSPMAQLQRAAVQDPYSFRCVPQVHGASLDTLAYVSQVLETEMSSVTDNPLLYPDEDLVLSGGNFHGQPIALVADFLAIALHELGNISERRTYQLLHGLRDLPEFLAGNNGLNSGLMIPQYMAASLVSQNKQLCTPASADSITSSNGQEDHVSMGANAALKLQQVCINLRQILAVELLTAAQAMHFRRPLRTSPRLEELLEKYRNEVPVIENDRYLHPDLTKSVTFLRSISIYGIQ